MPKPSWKFEIGGSDVTGRFSVGFVSMTITDGSGENADTVQIVLDDQDGAVNVPGTGVDISVSAGYVGEMRDFGMFTIDSVTYDGWPQKITISAQSAKAKSALKQRRPKSYEPPDYPTYGTVFEEVAGRHGLTLSMASDLKSKTLTYEAQAEEDDLGFLSRVGKRLDAHVSVKSGRLVVVKKGDGKSASGGDVPPIYISKGSGILSYSATFNDKAKHSSVEATWFDRKKNKRTVENAKAGSEGPVHLIREPFQNKDDAKDAATAAGRQLKRKEASASFALNGDPSARAEAPVIVSGIRDKVNGRWRAATVTHNFSATGPYTISIECEAPS